MGIENADNINVQITGSVASLVASMHEGAAAVEEATGQITGAVEAMSSTIEAAIAPLVALTALFESFEFLKTAIADTAEFGKQLEITGQKTGMAAEQLSALQFAADLSDVSVGELNIGLQRLARSMENAEKGTGPANDAFNALGIAVLDAENHMRPMHDVLLELAQRFQTMEDGAGKTAIAMDLFGRSGANLIPLLNQGAAGITELEAKAKELGVTMGEDGVEKANAYVDQMKEFHQVIGALERTLALEVMPTLTTFAGWLETLARHWESVWTYVKLLNPELLVFGEIMKRLRSTDPNTPLLNDPQLIHALGLDKKDPAPYMPPKDGKKGPSQLEQWVEELNKIKQAAIDNGDDLKQVELDFWKSKLAIAQEGSTEYIAVHSKIIEIEEQQMKAHDQAQKKLATEWSKTFEQMPKAFESAIKNMRQTAGSFTDFMREMWYELVAMSAAAGFKMLADWAGTELAKKNITEESAVARVLAESGAAVKTIAIHTWEGIQWIAIEAAKAAASAWATLAKIDPIILAPAVALATFAGVMALSHGLGGGGSTPGGSRSVPSGGGASSNATPQVVHVYAMDAQTFAAWAGQNPDGFAAGVKVAVKQGALTPQHLGLS